jgi:hypothetical protein
MARFVLALVVLAFAPAVFAMGSIVQARFVANAMKRGAIVWDIRGTEAYFDGACMSSTTATRDGMPRSGRSPRRR